MATFLLVWNPKRWHWHDIAEMSKVVKLGKSFVIQWSCGRSKRIQKGDRVFFIRLGEKPKGIFASGIVIEGSFEDLHWNEEKVASGETAMFITVQVDALLNPDEDPILPRALLNTPPFSKMHWDTQMSGIQIPSEIALELERSWTNYAMKQIASQQEVEEDNAVYEGAGRQVLVNVYERNPLARKKCIEHYGTSCFVCSFNFGKSFGQLGEGFIHVHHLRPLSEISEEYEVDPIEDMRPVCPNCHLMIHRRTPPLRIEEIKALLE